MLCGAHIVTIILEVEKFPVNPAEVDDCFEENSTITEGEGPSGISRYITINRLCKEMNASMQQPLISTVYNNHIKGATERRSIPKKMEDHDEIKSFLTELIGTGEPMNSLKLLVLGNGEVGKTSLLNSIQIVQNAVNKKGVLRKVIKE